VTNTLAYCARDPVFSFATADFPNKKLFSIKKEEWQDRKLLKAKIFDTFV